MNLKMQKQNSLTRLPPPLLFDVFKTQFMKGGGGGQESEEFWIFSTLAQGAKFINSGVMNFTISVKAS